MGLVKSFFWFLKKFLIFKDYPRYGVICGKAKNLSVPYLDPLDHHIVECEKFEDLKSVVFKKLNKADFELLVTGEHQLSGTWDKFNIVDRLLKKVYCLVPEFQVLSKGDHFLVKCLVWVKFFGFEAICFNVLVDGVVCTQQRKSRKNFVNREEGFWSEITNDIFTHFTASNCDEFVVGRNSHAINFAVILVQDVAVDDVLLDFLIANVVAVDLSAILGICYNQDLFPVI